MSGMWCFILIFIANLIHLCATQSCPTNSFAEKLVMNPPFTSRTYSSNIAMQPPFSQIYYPSTNSLLDDLNHTQAWISQPNMGNWIQIDAGSATNIYGVITQYRGPQKPTDGFTSFSLSSGLSTTPLTTQQGTSTYSALTQKTEFVFDSPIISRYIKITLSGSISQSMRVGLIVSLCSKCFSDSTSPASSISEQACKCASGKYKYISAINRKALSLTPGRAQFATLATRDLRQDAATASFRPSAGPGGKGAIYFSRFDNQYLDARAHTFNIASNTGFTCICVVKMPMYTENFHGHDQLLRFFSPQKNQQITMNRPGVGYITFVFLDIISTFVRHVCTTEINTGNLGVWMRIVVRYRTLDKRLDMNVNGVTSSVICTQPVIDRHMSVTAVGSSVGESGSNSLLGEMAGLYVVDEFLNDDETQDILAGIDQGVDLLQTCKSCAVGKVVAASGTYCECPMYQTSINDTSPCMCNLGYTGVDSGQCTICGVNTYKDFLGNDVCQVCPVDTVSPPGSTQLAACTPRPLFGGVASCGAPNATMMTHTLCQMIVGQSSMLIHTAAPLGTTQLVRYTFADSWGCHLQADLPAAQRISGAAPNQVLECPTVPGAVYAKQDAPCQFSCDENHTRTSDTCTRVCGNLTAAACEPRHFASTICNHAGYTLYQCTPCAYATGQQALPWSALTAATCPTAPCAAGTYGAGGVCLPCSQDNFSTAGSAACSPCARGTFAPVGSGVCVTCFQDTYALTQPGFGDAGVSITPGVMVVLKWPSSAHPVLLSINTNVAWNNPVTFDAPSFAVNVDATLLQTTFTVPESYTGALYYICQLHSSMGVHAITLLANTPCVAGAAATRSVTAVDAYFAHALAAGHDVSQHNQLSVFCHARGACLPCLPGEFEQAGACVACDFAHYQPNFQMPRCFECATGHNTSARGSRLAADCRCQPGFE